jgi:hypothetical protein
MDIQKSYNIWKNQLAPPITRGLEIGFGVTFHDKRFTKEMTEMIVQYLDDRRIVQLEGRLSPTAARVHCHIVWFKVTDKSGEAIMQNGKHIRDNRPVIRRNDKHDTFELVIPLKIHRHLMRRHPHDFTLLCASGMTLSCSCDFAVYLTATTNVPLSDAINFRAEFLDPCPISVILKWK